MENNIEEKMDDNNKQNNDKEIVKVDDKFKWIKEHKFAIGCLIVGAIGGTVAILNREKIGETLSGFFDKISNDIKTDMPQVEDVIKKPIQIMSAYNGELPKEVKILDEGKLYTPTELGKAMCVSAQNINKRLENAGLLEKMPSGMKFLTEAGKEYGQDAIRCMPWGKDVPTMEWDKNVLKYIFTEDEFQHRIDFDKRIEEYLLEKAQNNLK